jgi:alpha-L-arabinofuranosidase
LAASTEDVPSLDEGKKALNVSSTWDEGASEIVLKAVNVTNRVMEAVIDLQGAKKVGPNATVILLSSDKLTDENSLADPKRIYPNKSVKRIEEPLFEYAFEPYSFTVLRIPAR